MSKRAWIIFIAIVVVVLGGLIAYSRLNSPAAKLGDIDINTIQVAGDQNGGIADHVFGNPQASVVLVEYGDFQCPGCGGAHPNLKAISKEYQDDIAFVFRNLPLTSIHPNALAAAAVVEAAGLQGKYWEMHDLIFETQSTWGNDTGSDRTGRFRGYAESLGLDVERFMADLDSDSVKAKIRFDEALFGKTGHDKSTPTIILNGTKISAEVSADVVRGSGDMLRAEINKSLGR